jgi:hypothetical protein
MAEKGKFRSPFPGDNKSCYSTEGIGPYSRSFPKFSDQDGMRDSPSGDRDPSYNIPTDQDPDPETHAGSFSGKGMSGKVRGVTGDPHPGRSGKSYGLPPPFGKKR